MARRRLKMMMDLSVINNNNNNVKNEHNVHNLADIISSATIVFDEPEINSVVEINNEVMLDIPLENYEMNTMNADINTEDYNRMLEIPLENFELNTVNSDINIEDYNRMLEIPLENFELNTVNSDINIEDYNRMLEIPQENFELNTVNSDINIEEDNDNMLEIPLANNIPLCYELLTENILKPNDISNENEQIDVENINVNNVQSKANDTRSIKPQPNKWKRKISQRCRMNGQEYTGFQRKGNVVSQDVQRPTRNIQPICKSKFCIKAKNRFCQSFNENQRLDIFSTFWDSSWEAKKTFSCNMVTKMITKSNTTRCNDSTRRLNTYTYHLKYKDLPALQVCKKMFLE
ncbi:metacaspase-2-like [Rhopalosiphum padi]|uniref:metacaspase-2-like n=1 Tax=Rhopalosiphum padi TaxID=40932 RepID=UPI00298E5EFD|nr:metacaspase-2-like [Rhopalosiphum padi]